MSAVSHYDSITPETIKQDILADLTASGAAVDTREGSYADLLISETAYQIWLVYQQLDQLLEAAFPDATSGEYIDMAAAQVGLTRLPGAKAHATVTFTGSDGTTIPAGSVLYAAEVGLSFVTTEDTTIAAGTAQAAAEAASVGSQYNVAAGVIDSMKTALSGVASVTNAAAAVGGADVESDVDFWTRYHMRMSAPATSGNAAQYVEWALSVPGVSFASCIPTWNGANTVKVIIAGPEKAPVDAAIVSACAAYIETQRPIGAVVTVVSAEALNISVSATITLADGATTAQVEDQLTERVDAMLSALAFGRAVTIPYSRFLSCLLACPGVADYSAMTVNGETAAVSMTAAQTPEISTVEVTAS